MQTQYLGIDVAKAKLDCALLDADGKWRSKVVKNTAAGFVELHPWLTRHDAGQASTCMEATGVYWEPVAEYLSDAGFPVAVVNPAQIKAFAPSRGLRTKNDAVDARLIAHFFGTLQPLPWRAPSDTERRCVPWRPGSTPCRRCIPPKPTPPPAPRPGAGGA